MRDELNSYFCFEKEAFMTNKVKFENCFNLK
jgi:hypothetical protein